MMKYLWVCLFLAFQSCDLNAATIEYPVSQGISEKDLEYIYNYRIPSHGYWRLNWSPSASGRRFSDDIHSLDMNYLNLEFDSYYQSEKWQSYFGIHLTGNDWTVAPQQDIFNLMRSAANSLTTPELNNTQRTRILSSFNSNLIKN